MAKSHTNRLINEASPYLRQHAHNPVEWYPWGEEALRVAKEQDKPILLSIGYSSCHWCHVMERESFENEETAAMMNDLFVNIKVDREERPDLDSIYMDYVQLATGSGGWPLTVFLTPDQAPFYGGTYFPPQSAHGRPGFPDLLEAVARAYKERRSDIESQVETVRANLEQPSQLTKGPQGAPDESALDQAFQNLSRQFDNNHGGFGGAPKFPSAMPIAFLLRYNRRTGSARALEMVELTLQQMARGGMYDQLGGGFHRYSVDDAWLVPHFEKMLYDNALLSRLYGEAYQLTGNSFYRQILEETLNYVAREMLHPRGGFFSAQDADSEGVEGKYYVWSHDEVAEVLGAEDARIFSDYFGVTETGSFEGTNILHHRRELRPYAKTLGLTAEQLAEKLEECRQRLFDVRNSRLKPGLDDKIVCAWNGLMLTAFAEAAFLLDNKRFLEIAERNAEFLTTEMWQDSRLHRVWKDGSPRLNGYLEDYAFVIEGLIALYQASGRSEWLVRADDLMKLQIERFSDGDAGHFYFTSSDHEQLLVRQKEYLDNATPSGNSVSCLNLLRLAQFFDRMGYRDRAAQMLGALSQALGRFPLGLGYWLQALDFHVGPVDQIAIVGPVAERQPLRGVVRGLYIPNKVLAVISPGDQTVDRIALLAGKTAVAGKAAAYICRDYTCLRPATSADELEAMLTEKVV
ncbi:MAG: thioredoxin domain-containing protein [Acidobacteria bacterium]|nr:MAG: thioredoxin domain-containing protein [Acidobacteriota bacterium]